MDPVSSESKDRKWVIPVAGTYLVLLYLGTCLVIGVFGYVRRDRIPQLNGILPDPAPTAIPTQHILVHQPEDELAVIHEDFSGNSRNWNSYYFGSKVEVLNGILIVQSNRDRYPALAVNGMQQPAFFKTRYYQADFSTDMKTDIAYGLVFNMDVAENTYYLFDLSSANAKFGLLKNINGKWTVLIDFQSAPSRQFPDKNTLSAYVESDVIELYINGEKVGTFTDTQPLSANGFGAYADNIGFRLFVDDFYASFVR